MQTTFALIHKKQNFQKDFPLRREFFLLQGCFNLHHLWQRFTRCTFRVPREVTWTDIHLLMQKGWKSKDVLINSENLLSDCVLFWWKEFRTPQQLVLRQDIRGFHSLQWWMEQQGWFTITHVTQTLALVPELGKAGRIKEINGKVLQLQK